MTRGQNSQAMNSIDCWQSENICQAVWLYPRRTQAATFDWGKPQCAAFVFSWTASNSIPLYVQTYSDETQSKWTVHQSLSHFWIPVCVCVWYRPPLLFLCITCVFEAWNMKWAQIFKDSLTKIYTPERDCYTIPGWSLHSNTHGNTSLFQSQSTAQHLNTADQKKGGNSNQLLKELHVHTYSLCFASCSQI